MKIEYLQISNVVSFPYYENIESSPKILFDDGLNIIVGENGCGKSTVLEVINFIFRKVIFRNFSFNVEFWRNHPNLKEGERRKMLQLTNSTSLKGFRLQTNWNSEDKEQCVRIAIKVDALDKENISNIKKHIYKISKTINLYSEYHLISDRSEKDIYIFDVVFGDPAGISILPHDENNDFGFTYLTDYHLFKKIISLSNSLDPTNPIPPLYDSFAIIGSYRNYHNFQPSISLSSTEASQQIQLVSNKDFDRSLNASESSEPAIFALVKLQVAEHHFKLVQQAKDLEQCEQEANQIFFMQSINKRLDILNLRCQIKLLDQRTWSYGFEFIDTRRDKPILDINSLSAGQKAIIHLVFEAYGRGEMKGGIVVIDEPEIHLHYQFQNQYMQIIREINQTQRCQYIIVTHSESLINSSTINSVRRFALNTNNQTEVFSPELSEKEKDFIRILDNTRSTYAFFSKKVVLVEGDTDRYFFKALLQEKYPLLEQEIAILHVGGKAEFQKWKDLFMKFGLRVYVISDFDYITNLHYPKSKSERLRTPDKVSRFKQQHPDWIDKIVCSKAEDIFILREGTIETYLNINKGLSEVISFCNNKLQNFLRDTTSVKSSEIQSIIDTIATHAS